MITATDILDRYLCLWIGRQAAGKDDQNCCSQAGRRVRSTEKIAAMLMIENPAASRNA